MEVNKPFLNIKMLPSNPNQSVWKPQSLALVALGSCSLGRNKTPHPSPRVSKDLGMRKGRDGGGPSLSMGSVFNRTTSNIKRFTHWFLSNRFRKIYLWLAEIFRWFEKAFYFSAQFRQFFFLCATNWRKTFYKMVFEKSTNLGGMVRQACVCNWIHSFDIFSEPPSKILLFLSIYT